MTVTALKSADELKQYVLAFLKVNEANRAKNHLEYFRIAAQLAPSVKPENSFVLITLHANADEIARNVNADVASSEKHEDVHISNDELQQFRTSWKRVQVENGFKNSLDLATYRINDFIALTNE